jgi:hypothetical protein
MAPVIALVSALWLPGLMASTAAPLADRLDREVSAESPATFCIAYLGAIGVERVFSVDQFETTERSRY